MKIAYGSQEKEVYHSIHIPGPSDNIPELIIEVPDGFLETYNKARREWERQRSRLEEYWADACEAREGVQIEARA